MDKVEVFRGDFVYTVGHGSKSLDSFMEIVNAYSIKILVDIRSYPRSKRHPQYNREALSAHLPKAGVQYLWEKGFGGFRKKGLGPESPHKALPDGGFRNYADYMLGDFFKERIERLLALIKQRRTCLMCAETLASQCHRRYLSDYLTVRGVSVVHIVAPHENRCHTLSPYARIEGDNIIYDRILPTQMAFEFSGAID